MLNNLFKTTLYLCLTLLFSKLAAQSLHYTIGFPEPHTHYAEVELEVDNFSQSQAEIKIPVWTPGSYLIREFARHIDKIEVFDTNNKPLPIRKIDKNTWLIETANTPKYRVVYKIYAYEMSVRTSFIDQSHAYLNPASVLVYIKSLKDLPATLTFKPFESWQNISTSLPTVNNDKWQRRAANYDLLVDSPIEIGNHKIIDFQAANIPHTLAIYGKNNLNTEQAVKDMQVIIEESTAVFGENPCPNYLFILLNTPNLRGGLEHLYSTSLIYKGFSYHTNYTNWLSLVAHEYFHLWNVKRLRPKPLGPFNYNTENYTTLLWFAEGITSYYDNLLLARGNLMSSDNYLQIIENDLNRLVHTPGNRVQSVAEASFDAWIKYYRRNENSNNTTISYYLKGSILALLLDLAIIAKSDGRYNLDNLMRQLYQTYYKVEKRGFIPEEFKTTAQKFVNLDMDDFMNNYVSGTKPIDYQRFFEVVGVRVEEAKYSILSLGLSYKEEDGHLTVTEVKRGSPAYKAGINVNDEIIATDDLRSDKQFLNNYFKIKGGTNDTTIKFLLSRQNNIMTIEFPYRPQTQINYDLEFTFGTKLSPKQKRARAKWLE